MIDFPKCKCKWLTFLNPKSNPDLFQHFTIFNPILDQRNQRSTIKHAIHLISSSKLLTTKKNMMLFRSNLQIFRKSFSVAIFWSVPGSLVIKKFKTWKVSKFAASTANVWHAQTFYRLQFMNLWRKKKQKLEMIWRNWTLGSCSFLLLSENTSTKSQWRD